MLYVINTLIGNMSIRKEADYLIIPLKVLWIIYSLPFLILLYLAMIKEGYETLENWKDAIVKKTLLHIANIFWSILFWGILFTVITGK